MESMIQQAHQHVPEELREVLEARVCRADAHGQIMVSDRAFGGLVAVHAAPGGELVEPFADKDSCTFDYAPLFL